MRIAFAIIFIGMIIGLIVCSVIARRSQKEIGPAVAFFLASLVMPVTGNLIIIVSTEKTIAEIGCYTYFMDVVSELQKLVKEYGIDPKLLRVEITETVMMTDAEKHQDVIARLQKSGFIVEMDDFGSGYSSLNLLKDMPVDVLKIDMMFLRQTKAGQRARIIVQNIIRLTDELGIVSLTEGVESEEQFRRLSEMGCCLYQGYYFSKPIPVEEFEQKLQSI